VGAGDHNGAYGLIGLDLLHGGHDLFDHGCRERVAFVGVVQREGCDTVGDVDEKKAHRRRVCHALVS
jgi:hypothetical protein